MSRVLSPAFHAKLKKGATPTTYITIQSQAGVRVYAKRAPNTQFSGRSIKYGDGHKYGDGTKYGQGSFVISREPFLKSHGNISRALQVTGQARSRSGTAKRIQNLQFVFIDAKKILRKRFALDPILGKPISMRMGFADIADADHLTLFSGIITKTIATETTISVDSREL